jgi:hypothetical protein
VAQTRKRRRRKHRGTQGGRVDSRAKGRPRSRQEARDRARAGRTTRPHRLDNPPTWRSAVIRGIIAAAIFVALLLLAFGRPAGEALGFGGFMLLFYIPAGYFMDTMLWRRRERQRIRGRSQ